MSSDEPVSPGQSKKSVTNVEEPAVVVKNMNNHFESNDFFAFLMYLVIIGWRTRISGHRQ